MQYDDLKHWFKTYVEGFKNTKEDFWVYGKEKHTYRVLENTEKIVTTLQLHEKESLIAKTIALLHDVGRFPQLKKYGTFRDDLSEDHALISIKTIQEEKLLEDWPEKEQKMINEAIKWHNKSDSALPNNLDQETTQQLQIIRDADKIDIIKINHVADTGHKADLARASNVSTENTINDSIHGHIMNNEDIKKEEVTTFLENKIFVLNWIHQFYFDISIPLLKEQGDYEALLETIPEIYQDIKQHLQAAFEKRLISTS